MQLKKDLKEFWQQVRLTLFFVFVIFIVGILVGIILPDSAKIMILQAVSDRFADILEGAYDSTILGIKIFLNNLMVCGILFVSTVLILPPLVILFTNGLMIGVFGELFYIMEAISPGNFIISMLSLIPHGIFEIPAFILSAVFGFNLFIKLIFGPKILSKQTRKQAFIYYIKNFIIIIIPLLLIAALMEVAVSDKLITYLDDKYKDKYIEQTLKIEPSKDFLIQYNCHLVDLDDYQANNQNGDTLADTISARGENFYDQEFLSAAQEFSHRMHWQGIYDCDDNYLTIKSYEQADLPADFAQTKQNIIYDKLDYDADFVVLEIDGKTVMLFWDGDDVEILENIDLL